jgi:MerR family mercuric resistance operon transcriptional regulator
MSKRYTISQLAHAADIPTTTVRYYERVGLVEPEDRSAGNYRLYGEGSLRKLKFIRAAQAIGFTLDDVKALISTSSNTAASCREVQSLIENRLAEVDQRLKDLRHGPAGSESVLGEMQGYGAGRLLPRHRDVARNVGGQITAFNGRRESFNATTT